jgi:mono/diheme cytochrome c family protein
MRNLPFSARRSVPLIATALLFAAFMPGGEPQQYVALADAPKAKIGFNAQIRPILSNSCFQCHGPDEKKRSAKLRLDLREEAMAAGVIVPGKPEESELLKRAMAHGDDQMPPPDSKKPALTAAQIATMRQWILEGANYEPHWSFAPLSDAPPPTVQNKVWPKNPIDNFILARLETEGVKPSPEADKTTLLRRVTLDLTGLLPTPDETRAFLNDKAPDAYEKVVDKLLASPHYGERWGRHWLDQARYADSNGYTVDNERQMWPYRDWVIKAFNDDMPFDEFTIEQLAGDLLPNATKSQIIATAYHRNTGINEEGGTNPEQFRNEAVVDRTNTTATVWLGLTAGCAQCHTHKFDPITHREYYQLFAFFNSGEDVNNKGATVAVARDEVFGKAAAISPADVQKAQAAWEKQELARITPQSGTANVEWGNAQYVEYDTENNAGFQLLPDNSLLSDGKGSANDTYRVVAKTNLDKIAAMRLRVMPHESLPKNGPGTAGNGNFVLTTLEVTLDGVAQKIASARADHEQPNYAVIGALDDDPKSGWAINVGPGSTVKMNAPHEAIFYFEKPIVPAGKTLQIRLKHELNDRYLIGRFALDFAATPPPAPAVATDGAGPLREALQTPPDKRSDAQKKIVHAAFEPNRPRPNTVELMVMKEKAQPRQTFILQRGDFLRPDDKTGPLEPDTLKVLPPLKHEARATRLDLAKWLVAPNNPLTPRVTMNRIWLRYFGHGIVETDEDFGSQGAAPTNPELLDWLAKEFIQRGWSQKAMHRLIVTSATYRQSSRARPDLMEKDPLNTWLARQNRLRVEAEIVRDAALSASGLLTETVGGPGVRPPQPDGVYSFTQTKKTWTAATGPDRYRRALYTLFYRSAPYPLLTTFDSPDFQTVCTRRPRSDTPLQSLTLANDPAFIEIAQGLAARTLKEANGDDARLKHLFMLALSREPSPKEQAILQGYLNKQKAAFAADANVAKLLLSKDLEAGDAPTNAAWVCVARAVLNTDAFITRE